MESKEKNATDENKILISRWRPLRRSWTSSSCKKMWNSSTTPERPVRSRAGVHCVEAVNLVFSQEDLEQQHDPRETSANAAKKNPRLCFYHVLHSCSIPSQNTKRAEQSRNTKQAWTKEEQKGFSDLARTLDDKHTIPTLRLPEADLISPLPQSSMDWDKEIKFYLQHLTIRILFRMKVVWENVPPLTTNSTWQFIVRKNLCFQECEATTGLGICDYSVLERACLCRQVTIPDQRFLRSLLIQVRASIAPTQKVLLLSLFPEREIEDTTPSPLQGWCARHKADTQCPPSSGIAQKIHPTSLTDDFPSATGVLEGDHAVWFAKEQFLTCSGQSVLKATVKLLPCLLTNKRNKKLGQCLQATLWSCSFPSMK